jgi:hypothetical protein
MRKHMKILTSLVIGAVLLSTGSAVFAAETSTGAANSRPSSVEKVKRGGDKYFSARGLAKGNLENNLKALVSSGIITQEESDKLLALSNEEAAARQTEKDKVKNMTEAERKAYFEAKKEQPREEKSDIFTLAVSKGIITQAKADSVRTKLKETRTAEKKAKLTESLNSLVSSGTISKEQSDKIISYVRSLEVSKAAKSTDENTSAITERKIRCQLL